MTPPVTEVEEKVESVVTVIEPELILTVPAAFGIPVAETLTIS